MNIRSRTIHEANLRRRSQKTDPITGEFSGPSYVQKMGREALRGESEPMTRTQRWARLWAIAAAPNLRSGAWYPVQQDNQQRTIDLEVAGASVRVPRALVEIRNDRPHRFTVVYRPTESQNPAEGAEADVGTRYAVCPYSGSRIKLSGRPDYVECRECGYRGIVAWWETG